MVIASLSFREHIQSLLERLLAVIGHQEYKYTIVWQTNDCSDDTETTETHADITPHTDYLRFRLNIYPCLFNAWSNGRKRYVGEIILHEVCHLLTHPMFQWATVDSCPSQNPIISGVNEQQTQRTANAIQALLDRCDPDWFKPNGSAAEPKRSRQA